MLPKIRGMSTLIPKSNQARLFAKSFIDADTHLLAEHSSFIISVKAASVIPSGITFLAYNILLQAHSFFRPVWLRHDTSFPSMQDDSQ